ncbi:MAG TPA: sterol desaturase family protein [Dongiaceae bacterium]|jgi:sterol desaturase/sphingolipid hydroxylase (fatty acid hydroxylase superfamily)
MGQAGDPLLQQLLAAKGVIVGGWILLALAIEQWRPAAPPPLALAGYGAAWFKRWGRNLSFFVLNSALSALVVVPITAWAALDAPWRRADLLGTAVPAWVWLVVDLVLLDLWIYWWHRANHEWTPLWRFHEVHHRDRHLDATTALRFHFGEVAISAGARAVVIVALAIPLSSVIAFETLVLVATVFHHANWRIPPAIEANLARIIITPSRHWVHHHNVRADTDSTYGTIFSFWDRLFGTTTPTRRSALMPLGVEGKEEMTLFALIGRPTSAKDR